MLKKWAFVSDFDGTISKKDFYQLVMEKYFPEGQKLFKQWKDGFIKDIEFLAKVFSSINQDEEQIIEEILSIEIDEYVPTFIREVQRHGGNFYVLSAGTDYYIKHILRKHDVENVVIFSNEGEFREKNVFMNIDQNDWKYSERYGIDKSKVIQKLKGKYETVHFIGDSEPDSHPAAFADLTFAIGPLQRLLKEKGISFVPVQDFSEVASFLQKEGFLE